MHFYSILISIRKILCLIIMALVPLSMGVRGAHMHDRLLMVLLSFNREGFVIE